MKKGVPRRSFVLSSAALLTSRSSFPESQSKVGSINVASSEGMPFVTAYTNAVEVNFQCEQRMRYDFYLSFVPRVISDDALLAANKLLGTFEYGNPADDFRAGLKIPLSLIVLGSSNSQKQVIYNNSVNQLFSVYHSSRDIARGIAAIWLDSGNFNVKLKLLQGVPELESFYTFFKIGTPARK